MSLSLHEFALRLTKHDWMFSYADDHRAWLRGKEAEATLEHTMQILGADAIKLYRFIAYKRKVIPNI